MDLRFLCMEGEVMSGHRTNRVLATLILFVAVTMLPNIPSLRTACAENLAVIVNGVDQNQDVELKQDVEVLAKDEEPFVTIESSNAFAVEDIDVSTEPALDDVIAKGTHYLEAQALFGFSDSNVFIANTFDNIVATLKRLGASGIGSANSPAVVYVAQGTYDVTQSMVIPENVLLLSESSVVYSCSLEDKPMVKLFGSLYGGAFNGNDKAGQCVRIQEVPYDGTNGVIQKATIRDIKSHGILASGANCKNVRILDCDIAHSGMNGINVLYEATISLIQNCVITNNGHRAPEGCSGINLCHGNVNKIQNCTITNNTDKGISTNSDKYSFITTPGCTIGTITGCTISNNHVNGVYLKPLCHINSFTNNTLIGNPDGIVCVSTSRKGVTGASYVKNVTNNRFRNNTNSQLHAHYNKAVIHVGTGNTFTGGKNAVLALAGGTIKIAGNNNTIQGSTGAGIDCNGGTVLIQGSGTKIKNNATHGIYVADGTVTITGSKTQVTGNKQVGLGLFKNATVSVAGASTTIKSNKTNNVYVGQGSKLTISGKSSVIQGAGAFGVSVKSKGVLVIKGTSTTVSKNRKAGIFASGNSKITISGSNVKLQSNGTQGIYLSGSSASITGANALISSNKDTGIAVREGSTLKISGRGCVIKNNGKFGILLAGKSKATLTKVKLANNKKGSTRVYEGDKLINK
jgi:hypothetical protein